MLAHWATAPGFNARCGSWNTASNLSARVPTNSYGWSQDNVTFARGNYTITGNGNADNITLSANQHINFAMNGLQWSGDFTVEHGAIATLPAGSVMNCAFGARLANPSLREASVRTQRANSFISLTPFGRGAGYANLCSARILATCL
jgi:hypothetical protein